MLYIKGIFNPWGSFLFIPQGFCLDERIAYLVAVISRLYLLLSIFPFLKWESYSALYTRNKLTNYTPASLII